MKATTERVRDPLDRLREKGAINAQEQLHERKMIEMVHADLRARLTPVQRAMYDAYYKTPMLEKG